MKLKPVSKLLLLCAHFTKFIFSTRSKHVCVDIQNEFRRRFSDAKGNCSTKNFIMGYMGYDLNNFEGAIPCTEGIAYLNCYPTWMSSLRLDFQNKRGFESHTSTALVREKSYSLVCQRLRLHNNQIKGCPKYSDTP